MPQQEIVLADRLGRVEIPATVAMMTKSKELQVKGKDVIALSLGEPDFPTPQFIKDAATQAMAENYTTYSPVPGYMDLRQAICTKLKRDNHLSYAPEHIVVSTGAKQSIANVVMALINAGDEALIPAPYWVCYKDIVAVAGGTPIVFRTAVETGFKMTADALAEQIEASIVRTGKTPKLLIFASPGNPSGSVYSEEEMTKIAAVLAQHPSMVCISDEIYEQICFGEAKHFSLARIEAVRDQVITVNGVSKAWCMTGWRLGYIAAPVKLAAACTLVQAQFTSGTCSISQRATIAAMNANPAEHLQDTIAAFKSRRKLVMDALSTIKGLRTASPQGAFYVFPDVSAYFGTSTPSGKRLETAEDITMYLLEEGLVALVGGTAFGEPNCVRISYAASEEVLMEAMKRTVAAFAMLK